MTFPLPERASVVIIGGGIIGCSVAYHLAKAGWTDVILLERKTLTSGTTWHAAGLVGQLQGSHATTAFASYGVELLQEIEAETGQNPGFRQSGSISIALNNERMAELKRKADFAQLFGVEAHYMDMAQIAERWPLMNADGVLGGTGGDAAILSFNGNKIITTSGGGMLVTRHKEWADEARFLATQARDPAPHYEHSTFGYNYRLSNICAAIGLGQMEVLDARVVRRREIFERYKATLSRPGIVFMPEPDGLHSTRWLTALTIDPDETGITREDIRLMLLEHQIESRPLWKSMHMQPLYAGASYHGSGVDERLFANGLCLPSGSDMTDEQQEEVIERVTALLNNGR